MTKKTKYETPWGRINFHSLIEPSAYKENGTPEYVLELFFNMEKEGIAAKVNELEKELSLFFQEATGEDKPDNPFVKDGTQAYEDKLKKLKKALKKEDKSDAEINDAVAKAEENLAHLKGTKLIKVKSKFPVKLHALNDAMTDFIELDREIHADTIEQKFYRGAKVKAKFNVKDYDVNGAIGLSLYLNGAYFGGDAPKLAGGEGPDKVELDLDDLGDLGDVDDIL